MKKILAILICLLTASNALAQDLPLTQKQWYGIGVIGEPPETSSYSGITDQTAYLTGLVNVAGNTCFAAASASCYLYVALAGPLGVISTKLMDGTFIPITDIGIETLAGNYFWESGSARFEAWAGTAINIDDIASTTEMPYVGNFNHMWDTVNDNWDRMTGVEIRLSIKDMFALLTYSANMFLIGDTWYDWTGAAMNSDAVANATTAPWVGSFGMMHDTVGDVWQRLHAHAAGDALSATQMSLDTLSYNLFYDGTNYRRWQGITAAHNLTLPVAPHVLATMMAYDGATLDMLLTGATGELLVTDVATRPGEDAGNDWRKIKKEAVATYSPAKETSATVGTAPVIVLASKEVLGYPDWCVWLQNDDGADPFVDADVQVSPDNSAWVSLTWTACDTLAATFSCVYCVTNAAYRYVRVYVTAADANQVSVDAWITANTN